MRKISKVKLNNFQAHRNSEFEFDDFTGIVGPSDKGKTSIIRAIIWALYNNPSGNSFITRGEDTCSVTVIFNDGLEITRTKGSKINCYDIKSEKENLHLETFGVGPVDAVISVHGMREIDIFGDKQSLNICRQLDEPFFIGESPLNKAMVIGKLAKTEIIDLAVKNTSSDIRQKKLIIKDYKEKLKNIKSELGELKGLSLFEKAIEFSSDKLDKLTYINSKVNNIKSIMQKISLLEKQKQELNRDILDSLSSHEVIELIDEAKDKINIINNINKTLISLDKNIAKYSECKDICDKSPSSCLEDITVEIDEIIDMCKNINNIKIANSKLMKEKLKLENLEKDVKLSDTTELIDMINECTNKLNSISMLKDVNKKFILSNQRKDNGVSVINNLRDEYKDKLDEYKDELRKAGSCPTCGCDIKDINNIDEIIKRTR